MGENMRLTKWFITLSPSPRLRSWYYRRLLGSVGKDLHIGFGAIMDDTHKISIGDNVHIGEGSIINTGEDGKIIIGNNVMIFPRTYIRASNNCKTMEDLYNYKSCRTPKIIIEDNVLISYGVSILSGVRIGRNSIIGVGAVVTKDIPPYSIAVGIPAKVIKKVK